MAQPTQQAFFEANLLRLHPQKALIELKKRYPAATIKSVYVMRSNAKRRGADVPAFAGGTVVREREPKEREYGIKRAFVLAQPADMPTGEVVELAKKAGLSIHSSYVRQARLKTAPPRHQSAKASFSKEPAEQAAIVVAPEPALQPTPRKKRVPQQLSLEDVPPLGKLSVEEADFMGLVMNIGYTHASRLLLQCRIIFQKTLNDATETE